ncbi:uncharacterized protein PHACADRAFT_154680 [Phanerochaete carnosa HHB-10118-sp]|uniref:Uncharacterized protein n=2 Tax=Phanerochaete carnosa (strain HHB-10118-sp) TaxID=650164 RepID=K5VRC4_PHACS|nr:uncharacterized protein PHACADRAFT_154680 [Phanerochaete carnosa HHB-10118-sp]EKM49129.1 hypothetical protein PHACADRAFT_154680 [Phanerochaete carnosa HHB-10118-sp]
MFRWFRPLSAPDEIYASSLQTLHLGHALWYPEPHESGEPQIGDVGFMFEGAFIRLFNLDTSAAEKKVTFWDPPYKITEPVPPDVFKIDRRRQPLVPGSYRSHGVESKEIHASADVTAGPGVSATLETSYTCKAVQGAVIVLKSEAHAERIFEDRRLKKHIVQNHGRWCAYVKDELFKDVNPEDIVVVSGWVKTRANWAVIAFGSTSTTSSASAEGHVGGVAGVAAGGSHSRSVTGPRMERQGQSYLSKASSPQCAGGKRDQSVFVKRYKMLKRLGFLRKVVAGAGHDRLSGSGDGRSGSGAEGVTAQEGGDGEKADILGPRSKGKVADPLDILLEYILEVSMPRSYLRRANRAAHFCRLPTPRLLLQAMAMLRASSYVPHEYLKVKSLTST